MSAKEEVLLAFQSFRDALYKCDTQELNRLLAQDYRGYNLAGHLEGRDLVLEAYSPGRAVLERFDAEELHVDVIGDVGILTGKGYISGHYEEEPWEHTLRFCDIYVRGAEGWQLFLSQATPMEFV
jgi:ketosteroid isomerase-like protein